MNYRSLVLILSCVAVLPFASQIVAWDAHRDDVAMLQAELKKLRQERVNAATQTIKSCESAWHAGTIVTETYLEAIDSLAEARLGAADSEESRLRALEERVNTLRRIETNLSNHCEIPDYAREVVGLRLKSAEVSLVEEKLRAAKASDL